MNSLFTTRRLNIAVALQPALRVLSVLSSLIAASTSAQTAATWAPPVQLGRVIYGKVAVDPKGTALAAWADYTVASNSQLHDTIDSRLSPVGRRGSRSRSCRSRVSRSSLTPSQRFRPFTTTACTRSPASIIWGTLPSFTLRGRASGPPTAPPSGRGRPRRCSFPRSTLRHPMARSSLTTGSKPT